MIQLEKCEANLSRGCSMACISCNHGSAVAEHWFMEPESMERDLAMISNVVHFGVHILQGGEPLINKRFIEFMDVQARSGIADSYGMLTNGTLLDRMPDEFWIKAKAMNYEIRISWYPALKSDTKEAFESKAKEFDIQLQISPKFTHFWKMFKKQEDGGKQVWKDCHFRKCTTVHEGYLYVCPTSAFYPGQFPEKFDSPPNPLVDGIPLEGITEEKIRWMMEREEPLTTCAICTGGEAILMPWHQTRDRAEWIRESTA